MSELKKGAHEEINNLHALLHKDALKVNRTYLHSWVEMCKAAEMDASYHFILTSKAFSRSKIAAFTDILVPDVTVETFNLALASLSFVAMKMFKTIDVKLWKAGRWGLEFVHAQDWVSIVEELYEYLSGPAQQVQPQVLDPKRIYTALSEDEMVEIRWTERIVLTRKTLFADMTKMK